MTMSAPRLRACGLCLLAVLALLAAGCAQITVGGPGAEGTSTRRYIGMVTVTVPEVQEEQKQVSALSTQAVGLRLEAGRTSGLTLGYMNDSFAVMPPECGLIVIVRDARQLGDALRLLNNAGIPGGISCATTQAAP